MDGSPQNLSSFIFSHTSASCCKISFFLYSANRSSISISLAVVSTGFAEPKTFSEDTPHDLIKFSDLFEGFSSNSASGCATISGRGSVRGFKFNFGLSCTDSSINDKALEDCLFGETSGILERLPALHEPGLLIETVPDMNCGSLSDGSLVRAVDPTENTFKEKPYRKQTSKTRKPRLQKLQYSSKEIPD
uniref:Uncharacterized protein n=1 Tax=Glossina palpalis gambiensis TaxID=67801 RepID=A0A1B0BJE3_9MUSC